MNLRDAIQKAGQILDEERVVSTVGYRCVSPDTLVRAFAPFVHPLSERGTHPRTVQEQPGAFQFESVNFNLLSALLDQTAEQSRPAFIDALLSRLSSNRSFRHRTREVKGAGQWQYCASELPLVAEFLVRRGGRSLFIDALGKAALSPGLTLMLMQLEEMIALNFTLFTDGEYTQLQKAIKEIRVALDDFRKQPRPHSTIESNTIYHVCREVPVLCDSVFEVCRKARFLYVKGSLLPGMNLEVNQDKETVRTFLEKLGFGQLLVQSLEEAEKLYRGSATPFELKSCLGHLRSFLEELHLQACAAAQRKFGGSVPTKWGEALRYLLDNGVLTKPEELFASQFYTLMSDTGVHPLIAEREYARLMRNMSIEYGLLLLTKLNKLGLS
jgi:hypothetical protein